MSRNFCKRRKVDLLIDFLFNRKEGHEYVSITNDIETRLPLHESTSPALRPHLRGTKKERKVSKTELTQVLRSKRHRAHTVGWIHGFVLRLTKTAKEPSNVKTRTFERANPGSAFHALSGIVYHTLCHILDLLIFLTTSPCNERANGDHFRGEDVIREAICLYKENICG